MSTPAEKCIHNNIDEIKNPAPCPFNGAVVCQVQMFCDRCGWNPEVAAERLRRIVKSLKNRRDPR